jgi:hypothetical protein
MAVTKQPVKQPVKEVNKKAKRLAKKATAAPAAPEAAPQDVGAPPLTFSNLDVGQWFNWSPAGSPGEPRGPYQKVSPRAYQGETGGSTVAPNRGAAVERLPAPARLVPLAEVPVPVPAPEPPPAPVAVKPWQPIGTYPVGGRFSVDGRSGTVMEQFEGGTKVHLDDGKSETWSPNSDVQQGPPAPPPDRPGRTGKAAAPRPVITASVDGVQTTVTEGSKGRRYTVLGLPVTAVVRWLGYHGWTLAECRALCQALNLPVAENMLKCQQYGGKAIAAGGKQIYGPVPTLTDEQAATLTALRPAR